MLTIIVPELASSASRAFIDFGVIGVILAFYHAWLEHAFATNPFTINYAPYASFFGVPYWLFGIVWFPVVLAVGLWSTRLGKVDLKMKLLILLTVGNLFTVYLWYLDILVIRAFTPVYVGLYAANYALTGLVVFQNRTNDKVQGFVYGTVVGAVVGLIFGPFGVAACGIVGGVFGAMRNLLLPQKASFG